MATTVKRSTLRTLAKRTSNKPVRRTSAPRQKSFSVRTDPVLKQQVDIFLQSVGMSMSTAINLYLRKIVLEQRIPFEIPDSAEAAKSQTEYAVPERFF